MSSELSLDADKNRIDLRASGGEVGQAALKGMFGLVPGIGSLLGELVSVVIPNQKLERLQTFTEVLEMKLRYLVDELKEEKMRSPEFTDLYEDALRQASRSMSTERLNQIASILMNSLTDEELRHSDVKKLLGILGEVSDAELIVLKSESLSGSAKQEFYRNHSEILMTVKVTLGSDQAGRDAKAFQKSRVAKLIEVGLLEPTFKAPRKGEMPEFDLATGRIKATGRKVTQLGRLLLRYIDEYDGSKLS